MIPLQTQTSTTILERRSTPFSQCRTVGYAPFHQTQQMALDRETPLPETDILRSSKASRFYGQLLPLSITIQRKMDLFVSR